MTQSESNEESPPLIMTNNNDKMKPEFVEQPVDAYITKSSANLKCIAKYSISVHIECNNKIIVFKNETIPPNNTDNSNQLSSLIASIKRKDLIEFKQSLSKSKHFTCVCVAIGENNEKITSKKAIIRNSCKPLKNKKFDF